MISLTLALAITGCGFKTSSEPNQPSGNSKEPTQTTSTGNSKDIIEVSTVSPSDPYLKFDEGEDFDKNSVYDAYEQDLGVKITNKWIADISQFKERVKLPSHPTIFPISCL